MPNLTTFLQCPDLRRLLYDLVYWDEWFTLGRVNSTCRDVIGGAAVSNWERKAVFRDMIIKPVWRFLRLSSDVISSYSLPLVDMTYVHSACRESVVTSFLTTHYSDGLQQYLEAFVDASDPAACVVRSRSYDFGVLRSLRARVTVLGIERLADLRLPDQTLAFPRLEEKWRDAYDETTVDIIQFHARFHTERMGDMTKLVSLISIDRMTVPIRDTICTEVDLNWDDHGVIGTVLGQLYQAVGCLPGWIDVIRRRVDETPSPRWTRSRLEQYLNVCSRYGFGPTLTATKRRFKKRSGHRLLNPAEIRKRAKLITSRGELESIARIGIVLQTCQIPKRPIQHDLNDRR